MKQLPVKAAGQRKRLSDYAAFYGAIEKHLLLAKDDFSKPKNPNHDSMRHVVLDF